MRQMRPCWRSRRSTSPRRDPRRCSQATVCRRFSSRGRVCRKRSYYVHFLRSRLGDALFLPFLLWSRLGEVLLLGCHRVLIANINPMQFCIRPLFANINPMQFCIRPSIANISSMQFCKRLLFANINPMQFARGRRSQTLILCSFA